MERLFGAICRNIGALPGETFVGRASRWTDALRFAASLKPRDEQEWLRAADVTVKHFFAVHCLVLRRSEWLTARQRQKHSQDFLLHAKALREARLRYDVLHQGGSA